MESRQGRANRLVHEKSPYLLQHAYNPVDWYPWGPEALEASSRQHKPIFLSVGYSTCHWCHVMEHESFEDTAIAAVLNADFIPIKVDREERPDIDHLYMTAVQAMTGSGGWPMSVFLTPDLAPFFAGTYFPPEQFKALLIRVAQLWKENPEDLTANAREVAAYLREQASGAGGGAGTLSAAVLDSAFAHARATYDARHGGFGRAPKFPTPHKLLFLLRYAARTGKREARDMVAGTLDAMAAGGIHDQLGGGFHRYSTDPVWLVPHFEKMLYDQAGLAEAYLAGWQVLGKPEYATVARQILDDVLTEFTAPDGGFYAALDADSEGEEGTFYVWTAAEIDSILGPERGPAFRAVYGATAGGNWEGKNILHLEAFTGDAVASWAGEREVLRAAREKRPHPHRDEKVVTAWNGEMIEAMARAGAALGEPRYVEAAARAAGFIHDRLVRDGRLLRHWRDGAAPVPGFLDDYAFLGRGYLALYEATADPQWLERAVWAAREMDRLFALPGGGFRMTGADAETLMAPVIETYDGALPSGNSAAAMFLLRLGHLTGDRELEGKGSSVLDAFAESIVRNPEAHLGMVSALDFSLGPRAEIVIAGDGDDAAVREMRGAVSRRFLPNAVTAYRPAGDASRTVALIPYVEPQVAAEGKATAYFCRDYACRLPVHTARALVALLDEKHPE
jgi:uncharacterized protein YyaL (SSP411 family)